MEILGRDWGSGGWWRARAAVCQMATPPAWHRHTAPARLVQRIPLRHTQGTTPKGCISHRDVCWEAPASLPADVSQPLSVAGAKAGAAGSRLPVASPGRKVLPLENVSPAMRMRHLVTFRREDLLETDATKTQGRGPSPEGQRRPTPTAATTSRTAPHTGEQSKEPTQGGVVRCRPRAHRGSTAPPEDL